jgi:Retinoblastoma-associated protein B domain
VLRFLAYERTGLFFGRHLDQMVLAAVYATAKVRGLHQVQGFGPPHQNPNVVSWLFESSLQQGS